MIRGWYICETYHRLKYLSGKAVEYYVNDGQAVADHDLTLSQDDLGRKRIA